MSVSHKESVWDYPRPPRVEQTSKRILVVFAGETIADSIRATRVLETSHPPCYYVPPEDVRSEFLVASKRRSFCEFKGIASYWNFNVNGKISNDAAWRYEQPSVGFEIIRGFLAFYAGAVDECFVNNERVEAQPGMFYGGWITSEIVGPFKKR